MALRSADLSLLSAGEASTAWTNAPSRHGCMAALMPSMWTSTKVCINQSIIMELLPCFGWHFRQLGCRTIACHGVQPAIHSFGLNQELQELLNLSRFQLRPTFFLERHQTLHRGGILNVWPRRVGETPERDILLVQGKG